MEDSRFSENVRHARADAAAGFATIIDVRSEDEWSVGHIPGALQWGLTRMQNGEFPHVPKDRKVYLYCTSGARSAIGAELMRAHGWTDVINMGGMVDWQNAGGEVEP